MKLISSNITYFCKKANKEFTISDKDFDLNGYSIEYQFETVDYIDVIIYKCNGCGLKHKFPYSFE